MFHGCNKSVEALDFTDTLIVKLYVRQNTLCIIFHKMYEFSQVRVDLLVINMKFL